MPIVGATLRCQLDHGTTAASLSRERIGSFDPQFLYGIDGSIRSHRAGFPGPKVIGIQTVQRVVALVCPGSSDCSVAASEGIVASRRRVGVAGRVAQESQG